MTLTQKSRVVLVLPLLGHALHGGVILTPDSRSRVILTYYLESKSDPDPEVQGSTSTTTSGSKSIFGNWPLAVAVGGGRWRALHGEGMVFFIAFPTGPRTLRFTGCDCDL